MALIQWLRRLLDDSRCIATSDRQASDLPAHRWKDGLTSGRRIEGTLQLGKAGRGGIGAELGVYDDVFLCLSAGEPWLEHGIVEHRYKELCPTAYRQMIDRWGHVIQGPRRYSVTAFLTRAWAQLAAYGLLASQLGPATGVYHHNGRILYWALPPRPEAERIRTWAEFAADLGISPYNWTLPARDEG